MGASAETYQFVDEIPEVAAFRELERHHAETLLASRRNGPIVSEYSGEELLQVDALSTAHKVLEAGRTHGEGSWQHTELRRGLMLDCQRLVAEWYRKKKPEYFPPIRHSFDEVSEEFYSHGLSIRQMTENALTPIRGNAEEEARRVNERVEDATPHMLRRLGKIAIGSEAIRTISECADKAIEDYSDDMRHKRPHRGYDGYVPEIEKVMIRDIRLDAKSSDRLQEQIGLPGIYITHFIIQKALERKGVAADDMDKTKLHGSQLLVDDDLMDFVRLLDDVASEEWCTNVFMGEEVAPGHVKDYANFRQEALKRQAGLADLAETVTSFVLDLAATGADRRTAPAKVEAFVKRQLLELAKHDTVIAEQMFDERTARKLQEVVYLEAKGLDRLAFERMQEVEKLAPGGGFCGAGSCGIESADTSGATGKELLSNVRAKAGDAVVRDKERACRCGSKSIVYAYNKRKVNKYCENCGAFESKTTSVRSDYAKAA